MSQRYSQSLGGSWDCCASCSQGVFDQIGSCLNIAKQSTSQGGIRAQAWADYQVQQLTIMLGDYIYHSPILCSFSQIHTPATRMPARPKRKMWRQKSAQVGAVPLLQDYPGSLTRGGSCTWYLLYQAYYQFMPEMKYNCYIPRVNLVSLHFRNRLYSRNLSVSLLFITGNLFSHWNNLIVKFPGVSIEIYST